MSSLLRPAGPLPPRVYWVRRIVVVAIVAAVLLIVFWAVGAIAGGGGGTPAIALSTTPGSHSPSRSPSPSVSHTPSSPSPSVSHTPSRHPSSSKPSSPSPTISKSSSTPPPQPCAAKAVSVSVSTDAKSYPADVQPRLAMSIRNTGTVACTRDVGQAALELRISSSASGVVWSSDHCAPGGPHHVVTLAANQVFRTAVVWGRNTSKPGCPAGQPKAGAGSYTLIGRDLTTTSTGASFELL